MRALLLGIAAAMAAASSQDAGSDVTGLVKHSGRHTPARLEGVVDKDRHGGPHRDGRDIVDESVVVGAKDGLSNVLVRVKGPVQGEFPAPADPVVLDAADYLFRPRVVVVRPGQILRLKNSAFDRFNFTVKARLNREFNVGLTRGGSHDVELTEPEIGVKVHHGCCPWQVAWVHVIDHPFHAVTGAEGTFRLKALPPGDYEIEAWHERLGTRSAAVKVGGKGAVTHDFEFESADK